MSSVVTLKPGAAPPESGLPPKEGKYGIRVHSDNRTGYGRPDPDQARFLPGGATMIPTGKPKEAGGASNGFKAGVGKLNVSPVDEMTGAGGVTLDMTKITPEVSAQAFAQASSMTEDPQERAIIAYRLMGLSVDAGPAPVPTQRVNPLMPASYVAPQATLDGGQYDMTRVPVPQSAQPLQSQQPPQQPQQAAPPQANPLPDNYPSPVSPEYQAQPQQQVQSQQPDPWQIIQSLQGQVNNLTSQLGQLLQAPPSPTAPVVQKPEPEPVAEPGGLGETELPVEEVAKAPRTYSEQDVLQMITKAYGLLKIDSLDRDPKPPEMTVVFQLPGAGNYQTHYHWVVEQGGGLYLVYDNRFKYGTHYQPPDLGNKTAIRVALPEHNEIYTCYSGGFELRFGIFNITVLVLDKGSDESTATSDLDGPLQEPVTRDSEIGNIMSIGSLIGDE